MRIESIVQSLACSCLLLACGGHVSQEQVVVDDKSTAEAGSAAGNECQLVEGRCVARDVCCPPVTGRRVDAEKKCIRQEETPLACRGHAPPTGICTETSQLLCIRRVADGGDEIFLASDVWPGFSRCDEELTSEAMRMPPCK
jgi:hypothetical protein